VNRQLVVRTDSDHPLDPEDERQIRELKGEVLSIESDQEFLAVAHETVAILTSNFRISETLIKALTRCRVISRYGSGLDNIDVAAATRRGIPVAYVPVFCVEEVANRALTLLLACACQLPKLEKIMRSSVWGVRNLPYTAQIQGQTLGLIGFGKIGRAMAVRARTLGIHATAFDANVSDASVRSEGVIPSSLDDILRNSDFVSVHVPLTSETHHLLNRSRLDQMKPSAILINTARGAIVDEAALIDALRENKIAAAGLDVFEREPLDLNSPLLSLDNVVLTPHCASHTALATQKVRRSAVDAVIHSLRGERPESIANPEFADWSGVQTAVL
jgi:D-3-phosphoglycerate dehydrogenase